MQSVISIVIPTYGRDGVLVDSIQQLLALGMPADELLVMDQTPEHDVDTTERLTRWNQSGAIRWIRHAPPGVVGAMNRGLREAKGDIVLFLDDDIVPDPNLVAAHLQAYVDHPDAWAVVGQVVQGENAETRKAEKLKGERAEEGENTETRKTEGMLISVFQFFSFSAFFSRRISALRKDLDFDFSGHEPAWVTNVMAGNLSVRRNGALALGGFDDNVMPPVSFRFETEFAKRIDKAGGTIRFEPQASIRHLRVASGGTRSQGSHLTSGSPIHGVGDYYYALKLGRGWDRIRYCARRPFREVCTKFHLRHPWWIPIKLVGEIRAIFWAMRLFANNRKPKPAIPGRENAGKGVQSVTLIHTYAPDRQHGSMVRYGHMVEEALATDSKWQIAEIHLAPPQAWLCKWPSPMQTPVRYACIAWNARTLRLQRSTILHLLDGSHAYLLSVCRRLRAPLVVTVHDLIPLLTVQGELGAKRPGRFGAWLIRRTALNLRRADRLVADSENTAQDVARLTGIAKERISVVPPPVPARIDETLSEKEPSFVLHVAGNNTFYKNRAGVLEVFRCVREAENVRLKLVGAPPDRALREQVETLGLAQDVEFVSDVDEAELARLYQSASVFLFPSLYEGFGWPPLEAMQYGCPVVASHAGSLGEMLGDAALLSPPDDIETLAKHVVCVLRDVEIREGLIQRGRECVAHHTLAHLQAGLDHAYQEAVRVYDPYPVPLES